MFTVGMAALREEVATIQQAIRNIFDAEVLEEPRLRELTSEQAGRHAGMMVAKDEMRARINQSLSREQQNEQKRFRQQRLESKKHRRFARSADGEAGM